ncbi:MAG: hypothetical protein LRZ99_07390 [Desulfotomaculum sp.]|nr:hypothetical protein [Desulfotomaculum sp.]MCL0081324.1 hypothetical protein [Peptococcaceae bacterium]
MSNGMAENDQERQEYLKYIHDELIRLRSLVDELLDLRRLETGQINIRLASNRWQMSKMWGYRTNCRLGYQT